jgi:PadR family transcriptional regulator, regulatory protein PadR
VQDNVQKEVLAWRSQLRKGTLELAVLVALREKRRYGLELVDVLNRAELGMSEGSICPLLARLKSEGKVETEWVDTGVGHAHKYYTLTKHGRATLKAMLTTWREFNAAFEALIGASRTS